MNLSLKYKHFIGFTMNIVKLFESYSAPDVRRQIESFKTLVRIPILDGILRLSASPLPCALSFVRHLEDTPLHVSLQTSFFFILLLLQLTWWHKKK